MCIKLFLFQYHSNKNQKFLFPPPFTQPRLIRLLLLIEYKQLIGLYFRLEGNQIKYDSVYLFFVIYELHGNARNENKINFYGGCKVKVKCVFLIH